MRKVLSLAAMSALFSIALFLGLHVPKAHADGTDPIPLCPAGCIDGCKWIPGQTPVCTVPPKGVTHTLNLVTSECRLGPTEMRAEWQGDGIDFIATQPGDYTAVCANSVTMTQDHQCKIGICCHWSVTQARSAITVDANFNPTGTVWATTVCTDNSKLPQCNL